MKLSVSIRNLSKSYGTLPVLYNLSFAFRAPDVCCLTAPSGAGKTTLFRILMGLEAPDSGTVAFHIHDEQTGRLIPVRREQCQISAVFQEDRLIEHMTPLENAALVLPEAADPSYLRREFSRLLPEECLNRPVSSLSGGMRRRCALLRALLAPFDLLILDEPFAGLDAAAKKEAIRCLLEKTDGRLTLIATHSPEEVKLLGGRVYSFKASDSLPSLPPAR